ncbi:PPOX class F420-dependent oxidoreductase [Nitrosopumilus sp. b1]|uniref:PPOX class F420-dependent oxidoreductase n=1 Tax=Nitrosopumilus sp. b1 TaxID=2109907 RepID=UPI0015F63785|nr:PPOX class F420-dependent oxidoreductase [Nitrosopumilus sp. b1]KAF6242787.1 PPOX class F420-dependent oxidoreductase [Nitrosopumilus sp. b1]
MNSKAISLLNDKNLVYIATLMKDGAPQLSPVWANYENEHILVNTAEGRIKHKNVLRDPRVAISAVSNANPLDMTTIRGTVVKIIPDYDYNHADKLTKKYLNMEHYPFKRPDEKRIILKIKPERIFVLPELKMNPE